MTEASGGKPKLSVYWASSCGGCEIALVNLHHGLLEVDRHFELWFCPCLMDRKVSAVEALPDKAIAITLFNGAIRTTENLEMARLLRRKSRLLVGYGACATSGGIPALANLGDPVPTDARPVTAMPEGDLELPEMLRWVRSLGEVVEVDYRIPGCPPEPRQIWTVVEALIGGAPLPPKGAVLGGGLASVCAECGRDRLDKRFERFVRTYEVLPDERRCLAEQGIACMGMATRDGCGARCPSVNMPCTGCYGAPDGAPEQAAKMIAALGSAVAEGDLADPAGTLCRYASAEAAPWRTGR